MQSRAPSNRPRRWIWGAAAALGVAALSACHRAPAARSLILITIDTLRADHLSAYGYRRQTSPNLDAFMARGTRFANALATSSRTGPSHVAMMAGLYPLFTTVGVKNGEFRLSDDVTTLAEICQQAGMRTAAIVSNQVLTRRLGLDQGFETYDDQLPDWELNRHWPEQIAEHAVQKALAKLADLRGQRFFLWLHFQDPHGPYVPPEGWAERFTDDLAPASNAELAPSPDQSGYQSIPHYQLFRDERRPAQYMRRYDGEIAYLDSQLAKLFDAVAAAGLLQDTLVVVTSDHGEAFGEDGFFFAHGHSLGLDQIRVPLAFAGPRVPAGVVLKRPVSNISIFCTALNALNLRTTARCEQSDSLWTTLTAGREPEASEGFAASTSQWAGFRDGVFLRWDRYPAGHAVYSSEEAPVSGARYVPLGEQTVFLDGAAPAPATEVAALRAAIQGFAERAEASAETLKAKAQPALPLSPAQEERLRALGYLK